MKKSNLVKYINASLHYNYIVWNEFPLRRIDWADLNMIVFWEWEYEIVLDIATVFTNIEFIEWIAKYILETYSDIRKYDLWNLSYNELIDFITVEHAYAIRDNNISNFINKII